MIKGKIIGLLSLIALLTLTNNKTQAQDFKGGITAGLSASQVDGDAYAGFNKLGVTFGIFTYRALSDRWNGELGLNFTQKGAAHTPNIDNGDMNEYSLTLNYVEIPIVAEYSFFKNNAEDAVIKYRLKAGFGLAYSQLLSYKEDANYSTYDMPLKSYDLSTIAFIRIPLSEKLQFQIRNSYTAFFSPIREHKSEAKHLLNWGQYNSVITATLIKTF